MTQIVSKEKSGYCAHSSETSRSSTPSPWGLPSASQGRNINISFEAKSLSEHYGEGGRERERGGLLAQECGLTLNFEVINGCFKTAERVVLYGSGEDNKSFGHTYCSCAWTSLDQRALSLPLYHMLYNSSVSKERK